MAQSRIKLTNSLSIVSEESYKNNLSIIDSTADQIDLPKSNKLSIREDKKPPLITEEKIDSKFGVPLEKLILSPQSGNNKDSVKSSMTMNSINLDEGPEFATNKYTHYIFFVANPRSGNQRAADFLSGVRNFQMTYKSRNIRAFCHIFNVLDKQECQKSYNLIRDRTMTYGKEANIIIAMMGGDGSIMRAIEVL